MASRPALVGVAGAVPAGVGSFTVVSERLVAVVPSGHPLLDHPQPGLRAVCASPLICMPPGTGLRGVLDQACAAQSIRPAVAVEASAGEAIAQLARRGLGVGILSESMTATGQAGVTALVIGDVQVRAVLAVIWTPAARQRCVSSSRGAGPPSGDHGPDPGACAAARPDTAGVQVNDVFTRFLNGPGSVDHVISTTGAAVTAASPRPSNVVRYP